MDNLIQDLRYAIRILLKNPGFTAVAVIALALGIGANTAIFSVINAVLIRPLPFEEPDRLVWVWGNIRNGGNRASVSPLDFLDYREQNRSFEQFAARISVPVSFNLTGGSEPERLASAVVTGNYFQALGVNPALGRAFQLEDEKPGHDQVVVLSHGLWQRRFGGDPSIVNSRITLDGKSYEVIGVMPAGFKFPQTAEIWVPMNFDFSPEMKQRKAHFLRPVGRLKSGVSIEQAQADLDLIAGRLEELYPDSNARWSLRLEPLSEYLVGDLRPTLFVLLGAVGFVLLIACANVANLLLVRAAARRKEIAIRTALGAGRFRILRQMLTESLVLALLGGAFGVLIAAWGSDLLVALSADSLPPTAQIGMDASVLLFTLVVSLMTGVLFGLAPAFQTTRLNLNESLKEGGRGGAEGAQRTRMRSLLVVFESAVAVMLLVGAGLLIRSFISLQNVNPGFDAEDVLTMRVDLSRNKYDSPEKTTAFFEQLENRLEALPGVEAVGMVTELPLSNQPNDLPFWVEGRATGNPDDLYGADFRRVNQHYFQALRIPLMRGRNFTEQEVRESAKVVIISESLARGVFPDEDPIGKRLVSHIGDTRFEIIGIVGDIRHRGLDMEPFPAMYIPTHRIGWKNLVSKRSPAHLVEGPN
ncbi:MAG: ABC transporter permease, partial [Blastocatellia bacterium]|nr:ABC transporter permease [Blastocatellia bacterium]